MHAVIICENNTVFAKSDFWRNIRQPAPVSPIYHPVKPATCRPCVPTLGDSGTVPAITCDCSPVAELLMRRRYFDLCVTAYSRTMLTFENNVSCSSRDCSTIAFCRR